MLSSEQRRQRVGQLREDPRRNVANVIFEVLGNSSLKENRETCRGTSDSIRPPVARPIHESEGLQNLGERARCYDSRARLRSFLGKTVKTLQESSICPGS